MTISVSDIRTDLVLAHEQAWAALSQSGTWWSGAQRRELATTALMAVREAEPLPPWVGVSSVDGKISQSLVAPRSAHDTVYRIARHAETLTSDWYKRVIQEIDPLAFVELCGIVCTITTVVAFCNALDLEVPELAPAKIGEP